MSKLSIKTVRGVAHFRRAGMEFGREPVEVDETKIGKKKLEAIRAEPRLEVTQAETEAEAQATAQAEAEAKAKAEAQAKNTDKKSDAKKSA